MNVLLKGCCVHSHNPVGAKNIQSFINGFHKHMEQKETCYISKFPFTIEKNKNNMLEIKMTAVSKSESLLGIMFDQGEHEIKERKWVSFTRIRLGIIFLTLDFMWYHKN